MNKLKFNILILNWNNRNILSECIQSIVDNTYTNYIITVIDNGSTDDSVNYIQSNYDNVNFIKIPTNLGYALGYNYAFDKLKDSLENSWFLLLNNDTILEPDTLLTLAKNADKYGDANIYGCKILNIKNNKIWYSGGKISFLTGNVYHEGINSNDALINQPEINETEFVSGCCMLINSNLLYELNGFTVNYNFYYEDVDLCNKAKNLGSKCYYISSTYISHHISYSLGGRFSALKLLRKINSFIKYLFLNNKIQYFIYYIVINTILMPYYVINFLIKKIKISYEN